MEDVKRNLSIDVGDDVVQVVNGEGCCGLGWVDERVRGR